VLDVSGGGIEEIEPVTSMARIAIFTCLSQHQLRATVSKGRQVTFDRKSNLREHGCFPVCFEARSENSSNADFEDSMKFVSFAAAALALILSAGSASAQGVDKLYVIDCGWAHAVDQSRWSPCINVGVPIDMSAASCPKAMPVAENELPATSEAEITGPSPVMRK
jgi:hypothetical protein